jgi:hypothetical protein
MKRGFVRWAALVPLALCLVAVPGCKTNDDAIAASQQMATTAASLSSYYAALDTLISAEEDAQRAQFYLNGVPATDVIAQLEDSRKELKKRAQMAATFATLSSLLGNLTGSTAAADAATAAGNLSTEVSSLGAFTASTDKSDALKFAVTGLVNAIRAKDEVKAAKSLAPVIEAVSQFFDSEQDTYASFADAYYQVAASNAILMVSKNQVETSGLYVSSLQPFGLAPRITDTRLLQQPQADLTKKINDTLAKDTEADKNAANDLSVALHVMVDRIKVVSSDKPLSVRLPPFTLEGVKSWVDEVKKDIGATS